jgi:hypothetical protein
MTIYANERQPTFMARPLKIGERIWYPVSWERKLLDDDDEIFTSSWNVPAGFTVVAQREDVICLDENGVTLTKCNMALIEASQLFDDAQYIENEITVSDGETRKNGFYLKVKDFT